MAFAEDARLIQAVTASARALGRAATWPSGRALNVQDDFLYELFLLFRVVTELSRQHRVEYIPGEGRMAHEFPRKPARKRGRPRFHVVEEGQRAPTWQVCAGTQASDIDGSRRGLDLSIQRGNASEDPGPDDVLRIYDAKYRKDRSGRLSHPEVAHFGLWVELFGLRDADPEALAALGPPDLDANCLVTNGRFSTEQPALLARLSVREVAGLYPDERHKVRPEIRNGG